MAARPYIATDGDKRRAHALLLARCAKGLTQRQLGRLVGVSMRTVRRWETPTRRMAAQDLDRLRDVFGPFDGEIAAPRGDLPEELIRTWSAADEATRMAILVLLRRGNQ